MSREKNAIRIKIIGYDINAIEYAISASKQNAKWQFLVEFMHTTLIYIKVFSENIRATY